MGAHFHHSYSTKFQKSHPEQSGKKEKRQQNWKEVKLSQFADDMGFYI